MKKMLLWILIGIFTFPATSCKAKDETESEPPKSLPFLVVDLDGDGIELLSLKESKVYFDVDGDGLTEHTEWVSPDDGIMAVSTHEDDAKGDTIQKRLLSFYTGGLKKLESFDLNNDGAYDETDRVTKKGLSYTRPGGVSVWLDKNSNGYAEREEQHLFSAACSVARYNFKSEKRNGIEYSGSIECKNGKRYFYKELHLPFEDSNLEFRLPSKKSNL